MGRIATRQQLQHYVRLGMAKVRIQRRKMQHELKERAANVIQVR